MKITRFALEFKDIIGFKDQSLPVVATPLFPATRTQVDANFLNAKNVIISGDFFPSNKNAFKERLLKRKVNVQPQLTPETEYLICGKYPNWILVEQASLYGIKIIFTTKPNLILSNLGEEYYPTIMKSFNSV